MAVSIVQSAANSASTTNDITITLGAAPTNGNLLVLFLGYYTGVDPVNTPSGWTLLHENAFGTAGLLTLYRTATSGMSATFTFTNILTGDDDLAGVLYEISGQHATTPINQEGMSDNPNAGSIATSTETPNVLSCLALAAASPDAAAVAGSESVTVSSGWTKDHAPWPDYHGVVAAHRNSLTSDTTTGINVTFSNFSAIDGPKCANIILIAPAATATTISPADIALGLTEDGATISQVHSVSTQDIALALREDNDTITQNHVIAAQDIALGLTEDNATIAHIHVLAAQDIALALTEDNDSISQNHVVATQDIALALTEDNTTLSQNHVVAPADISLGLTEDNTTVAITAVVLSPADILLNTTLDNATISQNHVIAPSDVGLALSEDNATITQVHVLSPTDVSLALSEDNTTVSALLIIVPADIALGLTEDAGTISQVHSLSPADLGLGLTEDASGVTQGVTIVPADVSLGLGVDNAIVYIVFGPPAPRITVDRPAIRG